MGICEDAPDNVCGFVLEPGDRDLDFDLDGLVHDVWHEVYHNACCLREPEYDGQCVWHAEVEKEADKLAAARLEPADLEAEGLEPAGDEWKPNRVREHLGGVILRDVELPDKIRRMQNRWR